MALSPEMLWVLDLMVDTIDEVCDAIPSGEYGRDYQYRLAQKRIGELRDLIDTLRPNTEPEKET